MTKTTTTTTTTSTDNEHPGLPGKPLTQVRTLKEENSGQTVWGKMSREIKRYMCWNDELVKHLGEGSEQEYYDVLWQTQTKLV